MEVSFKEDSGEEQERGTNVLSVTDESGDEKPKVKSIVKKRKNAINESEDGNHDDVDEEATKKFSEEETKIPKKKQKYVRNKRSEVSYPSLPCAHETRANNCTKHSSEK